MANIRTFLASAKDHVGTTTLTGLLSIPSAIYGLLPVVQDWTGTAAAFFAGVAVATLFWVHRKGALSPQQTTFALGWFSGALVASLICLVSFAKGPPAQATPVAILQVDPKAPPCMKLVQYGYKCSEDDFLAAMQSKNEEAIKLFVQAGQTIGPSSITSYPKDAWRIYAEAMIAAGRTKDIFKCDAGLSPYGCAVVENAHPLACGIKPLFSNDASLTEHFDKLKREAGKEAAAEYDEVSSYKCDGSLDSVISFPMPGNADLSQIQSRRLSFSMGRCDAYDSSCEATVRTDQCQGLKADYLRGRGSRASAIEAAVRAEADRQDRQLDCSGTP